MRARNRSRALTLNPMTLNPMTLNPMWRLAVLAFACAVGLVALGGPAYAAATPPAAEEAGILTTIGELLLRGGILMIPIALCSILTVGLAIERAISLRQIKVAPTDLWDDVEARLSDRDIDGAREVVAGSDLPLGRMLHAGLVHWEDSLSDVAAALEDAGQREADDLERNLPALQGVVSVAPLLGLLGTVVGMIQSFYTVAKERALGNPELLAEGIGQALVTTAAGLSVAIPALVLYYIFRGQIRKLVRAFDDASRGTLALHRDLAG